MKKRILHHTCTALNSIQYDLCISSPPHWFVLWGLEWDADQPSLRRIQDHLIALSSSSQKGNQTSMKQWRNSPSMQKHFHRHTGFRSSIILIREEEGSTFKEVLLPFQAKEQSAISTTALWKWVGSKLSAQTRPRSSPSLLCVPWITPRFLKVVAPFSDSSD